MDPVMASLLATGGSALFDYLFGGDQETMTPEQRRALEYVWAELQKPQGYSTAEKEQMGTRLRGGLQEQSQRAIASSSASLARRGMYSPGQATGLATATQAAAGRAYGQGLTDIELASAEAGRQRKGQLLGMLPDLSAGTLPAQPNLGANIGDFMSNLAYYYASKKKKPDYEQGTFSNLRIPKSVWGY